MLVMHFSSTRQLNLYDLQKELMDCCLTPSRLIKRPQMAILCLKWKAQAKCHQNLPPGWTSEGGARPRAQSSQSQTQSTIPFTVLKGLSSSKKGPIVPTGTIIDPLKTDKAAAIVNLRLCPKWEPQAKCHQNLPPGWTSEGGAHARAQSSPSQTQSTSPFKVLKGLIKLKIVYKQVVPGISITSIVE